MSDSKLDTVKNISEAVNDAFFAVGTAQNKIQFHPRAPLNSLTSGSQQFTIIADTEHGTAAASQLAYYGVQGMADSGVKHIMLEMHAEPELQELLDKLYQNPPQISDLDFLDHAYLFNAQGDDIDKVMEDGNNYALMMLKARNLGIQVHLANDQAGYAQSDALREIEIQQENLRNQNSAFDEYLTLSDQAFSLYSQREALLDQSFELGSAVRMAEDKGLSELPASAIEQLSPEALDLLKQVEQIDAQVWTLYNEIEELKQERPQIIDLEEQYNVLVGEWLELNSESSDQRMSIVSEEARADKFIELANGEKSVVIFGAGHMDKENDLNEALDNRLRQDSFQNGGYEHFVETQVIAAYESREDFQEKAHLRGEQSADVLYFSDEDKGYITSTGRDNLELNTFEPSMDIQGSQFAPGFGQ